MSLATLVSSLEAGLHGHHTPQQSPWRKKGWRLWWHILASLTLFVTLYSITTNRINSSESPRSHDDLLIDFEDFRFLFDANRTCDQSNVYILAFVHSKPDHFLQRSLIRNSWGSLNRIGSAELRVIFLLGSTSPEVQNNVELENERHGDIVQGNFVDSYRNLTYKHLMGFRWVMTRCNNTRFVLKTDDDVFIDIFQLYRFLSTLYDPPPPNVLICNVLPAGTAPRRAGKWSVSESEYPRTSYPKYCGGLAYVITVDLLRKLHDVSPLVPYFWIDDVYVTGLLGERAGLENVTYNQLNLRTTYENEALVEWAGANDTRTSPYFVATVGSNHSKIYQMLWTKTVKIWKGSNRI